MKFKNLISLAIVGAMALPGVYSLAADNNMNSDSSQMDSNMTTSPNATTDNTGTTAQVDDNTLTQNIKDKISHNRLLSQQNIETSVSNGVVGLSGDTKSENQAILLIVVAGSTPGVSDIDVSKLTVNGQPLSADATSRAKVKAALLRDNIRGVMVMVNNGTANLKGMVRTQDEADRAESVARSVNGISDVKSNIKVMNANNLNGNNNMTNS